MDFLLIILFCHRGQLSEKKLNLYVLCELGG